MKIEQNKKRKRKREKGKKEEIIIVVVAPRRRAMTQLGRVTFSPGTTSGVGSAEVSLWVSLREKERIYLILIRRQKGREVRKIKHAYLYLYIYIYLYYIINAHVKKI